MILGLNTDVRYKGKTFHIQTEDSGVQNPVLITHVFIGGTIIETVRSNYKDVLDADDFEDQVRSLMRGQHRATYKALLAGDFDEAAKRKSKRSGAIPLAKNKGPVGLMSAQKAPAKVDEPGVDPAPSQDILPALPKVNTMGIEELDDDDVEILDADDISLLGSVDVVLVEQDLLPDDPAQAKVQVKADEVEAKVELPKADPKVEPPIKVEYATSLVCGRPLDPVVLGFLLEDLD